MNKALSGTTLSQRPLSLFRAFLKSQAASGIVLMGVAVLALIVANSPLGPAYAAALKTYVLGLSVLHWINDGLMAVFFLLVGLEIKREMLDGQLSTWPRRRPARCRRAGGMVGAGADLCRPSTGTSRDAARLGHSGRDRHRLRSRRLSPARQRVPPSLKMFLTALAIIDDLGAVVIIAVFYTGDLSCADLAAAAVVLAVLVALNRCGCALGPYLLLGAALWFFVLQSGVHATLAGVALALTIPLAPAPGRPDGNRLAAAPAGARAAPLGGLCVVPIFGFANAGVSLRGPAPRPGDPLTLGIALGLFVGKLVGVFGFAALPSGWASPTCRPMPAGAQMIGVAMLCGIGFTMSLFIGPLAFPNNPLLVDETKLGVLAGSALSALVGYAVLRFARPIPAPKAAVAPISVLS